MKSSLKKILLHPLTQGMDLDSPETTCLRRRIIKEKAFLSSMYAAWYGMIKKALKGRAGPVLEIGSGAGFIKEFLSDVISSDLMFLPDLNLVMDARELPFKEASLDAIIMTDVFHHIPDCRLFLMEAARCIKPGGKIIMIEPWVTNFSRRFYSGMHHEPFLPSAKSWKFKGNGPLSAANGALPWIVFHRDKEKFQSQLPMWTLDEIKLIMPFTHILSGGFTYRLNLPGVLFPVITAIEHLCFPLADKLAISAFIQLTRKAAD